MEDFAALGVLNEAAVARGHRTAHDEVARRLGAAAGGVYGLLEGTVSLSRERVAVWVDRAARRKAADVRRAVRRRHGSTAGRRCCVARSCWAPRRSTACWRDEPPAGVAAGAAAARVGRRARAREP